MKLRQKKLSQDELEEAKKWKKDKKDDKDKKHKKDKKKRKDSHDSKSSKGSDKDKVIYFKISNKIFFKEKLWNFLQCCNDRYMDL